MKRILLSLTALMACIVALAITQPEDGKYYRIVNQNPDKSVNTEGVKHGYVITENTISHGLTAAEPGSNSKYNQIWMYTDGKFKNAHTSRFITSLSQSRQGITATSGTTVTITDKTKYFLLTCGMQIHADGSNVIVGWNDEGNKSNWWDFEEVDVDLTALGKVQDAYQQEQAQKAELEKIAAKTSTYAPIVAGYFKDGACTELKDSYAAMTDVQMKEKMTADALPEQLQTIVLRIKNKWSDELNPTLSERFRIQNYKVYSKADIKSTPKATQMSDQNNPTGIWTNSLQLMYVFVEGDVPEGTSLRIASSDGPEVSRVWWNNGNELKKGLNIFYCGTDNAYQWIMYVCDAQLPNASGTGGKKLSEYPDIKIHIEGGDVLGYADVAGKSEDEANAEYELTLKHANAMMKAKGVSTKQMNFAVKGERGLMLFPVDAYNQIWSSQAWNGTVYGYKIYKSIYFYDSVLKWEWSIMGWQDRACNGEADNDHENLAAGAGDAWYPSYINNLAPTMMYYAGKNPYSSDGYTCMPSVGAIESSYNAERANFDTWCVGHESGHNNQGTINLPSSMESSNNYFSNVITYLWGYKMSRGMTFMENMDYAQQNVVFPRRSISMTLRMYWNLYMYYHRAGHNKGFSQKLHQLLRKDPMSFGGEGWWEGPEGGANMGTAANSWLKFYEKACEAAGEDLTEYFRLWGFFIPTEKAEGGVKNSSTGKWYAYCGDYSSYYIRCEQADIDAAIKRVKAKGYRVNKEIMFIEDRLELQKRTDIWAGKTGREYKETENEGYISSTEALKEKYGDLGYVEHYKAGKGTQAADYSFTVDGTNVTVSGNGGGVGIIVYNEDGSIGYMSNRFRFAIPSSVALTNYTIKVINGDGSEVEAADKTTGGKDSQLANVLQGVVDDTNEFLTKVDNTGSKVGYYLPAAVEKLNTIKEEAAKAISDKNAAAYVNIYNRLSDELNNVKTNGEKVQIEETGLYTIKNNSRGRYLTNEASTAANANADNAKWAFVKDGAAYYMQNYESQKLISGIYGVNAGTLSAAASVRLVDAGNGCWYLKTPNESGSEKCLNNTPSGEQVIGWSEDGGSQWYITKVADIKAVSKADINALIKDTKTLVETAGTISVSYQKMALQSTDKTAPNYVATNKANSNFPIANLIDGNKNTDFYTKKESSSTTAHNFYVDLGEGNGAKQVRLTITTPNNGLAPQTIVATPGESTLKYYPLQQTKWTDLPSGEDAQVTKAYDTDEADKEYRVWRFQVTAVNGSTAPQFGLAEIQLRTLNTEVTLNTGYEALEKNLLLNANNAQKDASSRLSTLSTPLSRTSIYEGLTPAYEALRDAMQTLTDIESTTAEKTVKTGIYDMQGRSLEKVTKRGLYIINGKKVMK